MIDFLHLEAAMATDKDKQSFDPGDDQTSFDPGDKPKGTKA
jgi:hypothetical protein